MKQPKPMSSKSNKIRPKSQDFSGTRLMRLAIKSREFHNPEISALTFGDEEREMLSESNDSIKGNKQQLKAAAAKKDNGYLDLNLNFAKTYDDAQHRKAKMQAHQIHQVAKDIRSRSKSGKDKKAIKFPTPNRRLNRRGKSISNTKKKAKQVEEKKFDRKVFLENLEKMRTLREELVSVRHFTPLTKRHGGKG